MPKRIVPLSDVKVRNAKPKDKEYKLSDGGGLYLLVTPTGGKLWRMKYSYVGKEKLLTFGAYPAVTLSDARQRREDAKKLLANSVDPGAVKKAQKEAREELAANTFEIIAREWHAEHKRVKKISDEHAINTLNRLEKDVFPWIGKKPIVEVKASEIKSVLDRIKDRGVVETARRVQTIIGQVYRHAIKTDRAQYDLTAGLKGHLPSIKDTRKHMAAITDPKELAPLLRAIDGYSGSFIVRCALKIAPMVFVRPGELRKAEWSEFDFDKKEWSIPAEKMKMKVAHIVPLSDQVLSVLEELKPLTGSGRYLFPSIRSAQRPMSDNTVNAAFKRMGFDGDTIVGHGLRATARTLIHEILGFTPDAIEAQLAHLVPDRLGRAYNRTLHLAERRKMMAVWADYLEGLKKGATVIPFKKAEGE